MERYIPMITRGRVSRIPLDEIIYIMKVHRKVRIVTREQQYEYYERLENLMQYLDSRFYTCLKGTVINLDKVERMEERPEERRIYFLNGEYLLIGRDNFIRTKQRYAAWLKNLIN